MPRLGILLGKEHNLVKDLERTTLSFEKLGEKYRVSRQAVHDFCKRRGIRRPKRPRGHQTEGCRLCQNLIQINKRPHSEFISIRTILEEAGGPRARCIHHLRILREKGLVNEKFGRLVSKRAERAYAIYFTKRLPIRAIGRRVGYKSFYGIIQGHRKLGWNVPPSLYVYDGRERSRIQSKTRQRRQR